MATWARGVDFKNSTNTTRVGGIGIYGTDATTNKLYIGLGAEPWNNAGLQLTSSAINFKGNKIYHAGDKPTASEIGAAAASHSHNYLPLSGGAVTSSNFGPLVIKRSGSTNASTIVFSNDNGTLGSIGMTASKNGGLIRWTDDTSSNYTILDTGNYKSFVTPASIGAAAASHNHDVLISAGGRIASADIAAKGDRGLRMYLATRSMTTGKPASDGFILNFDWDTAAGWSSQMYIKNSNNPIMQIRGMNEGTWGSWYTLYSTNNKPTPAEIGAAAASHNHTALIGANDTRSKEYTPATCPTETKVTFQNNDTNGVNDGGNFYSLMHIPRWAHNSGGYGSQFAFTDNENIWYRKGTSDTAWTGWKKIWHSGNFDPNSKANSSHAHNYAGSSSAGGAATTALACTGNSATATTSNYLASNTRIDYGWNGVNYFNISGTAGNAAKANDTPTTAWWHVMRFNHANSTGYYTDLAIPFNDTSLYYKRITAGSVQNGGWVRVLDSLNYNSYAPTKTGGGASGTWGISVSGNASTATKLATARTINGTSFNGSANITTAQWGTARTLTVGNTGKSVNGSGNVSWSLSEIGALPLSGGTLTGRLTANGKISMPTTGSSWINGKTLTNASIAITTKQTTDSYHPILAVQTSSNHVVNIGGLGNNVGFYGFKSSRTDNGTDWHFVFNADNGTVNCSTAITSPAFNGNASTATTLQTARTINGTSFNGSANITTSNWGTARTITIGNTGKSVNGSGNVSWSLSEIGAAASSHTHSYLPLSGGTITGDLRIAKSNAQITFNGKDTNYYQIAHSSANGTLVFNYNGKSLFTVQNNGSIIPTTNKDMTIGDYNFKLKSIASEDFSTSSAKIIPTAHPNTIQVQGTQDSGIGAIKLGTGGCRIYGTNTATRLFVEGGIYTNLLIECGDQIIANGSVYPGRNAQGGWDCGLANRRFYTVYCVNVNQSSDRSMKEDINYIDNEIALLSTESENPTPFKDFICNDLKVATYKYKRQITIENEDGTSEVEDIEHEPQDSQIGFIAQDIRDTEIGSMFVYGEDGNMNYSPSGFTTVVAKALQEEIKTRDLEIEALKNRLKILEEKLGLQ